MLHIDTFFQHQCIKTTIIIIAHTIYEIWFIGYIAYISQYRTHIILLFKHTTFYHINNLFSYSLSSISRYNVADIEKFTALVNSYSLNVVYNLLIHYLSHHCTQHLFGTILRYS